MKVLNFILAEAALELVPKSLFNVDESINGL